MVGCTMSFDPWAVADLVQTIHDHYSHFTRALHAHLVFCPCLQPAGNPVVRYAVDSVGTCILRLRVIDR